MSTQRTLITADEFLEISAELSERGESCELINGEVVRMPPAGLYHGQIGGTVAYFLNSYVRPRGIGKVVAGDPGIITRHDPDTVRAPDVAFISKERFEGDVLPSRFAEIIPDLVVEVVSPNDRASYIQNKVQEWLQAGARLVWIMYPDIRTIFVHRSPQDVTVLSENDTLDGKPVFDDFEVPVKELFT